LRLLPSADAVVGVVLVLKERIAVAEEDVGAAGTNVVEGGGEVMVK
jgi:hypothetical protein